MDTQINYTLDEQGVFRVKISGGISLRAIQKYLEQFRNIKNLPKDIRLLYDLTEAHINMVEADLQTISQMAAAVTERYTSVRTAFVVSKPDVSAFTLSFTQLGAHKNNKRYIFSNKEAAISWLLEKK